MLFKRELELEELVPTIVFAPGILVRLALDKLTVLDPDPTPPQLVAVTAMRVVAQSTAT